MRDKRETEALDDRLARLGREWFAELRAAEARERDAAARRPRRDNGGDADGGFLDFLLGDGDSDCDSGGDSCD